MLYLDHTQTEKGEIMAKLSAHGKELSRYEKQIPDSESFHNEKSIVSVRSDGHMMICYTAYHKGNNYGGTGYQTWGWKLWKRVKEENRTTKESIFNIADSYLLKRGFIRVFSSFPMVNKEWYGIPVYKTEHL